MTDVIEQDALLDPASQDPPPPDTHTHEVKSFVATPRQDLGIIGKIRTWFKSELKPGIHVVHKDNDPLRYMILITSNSYQDRENETITTKALEEYEQSCYPGEGFYHNENRLVYWHDDDAPIGDIIAVNVSGPFLVEVAKELPTPFAKVIWDIAETTEHAGVSHRFGYLEKDRDPDGTFHRIFKDETTWLPDLGLAANGLTYAGVVGMASPASDKWLDETFERIAGIKGASTKLHAKTGELEKELEAAGISHKAFLPKAADAPPAKPAAVVEGEEIIEEEDVEEDVKDVAPLSIEGISNAFNQFMAIVMDLVDAQGGMVDNQMGMAKELTELKEMRVSEKAIESTTLKTMEDKLKALETSVAELSRRASLAPRSASRTAGEVDPDTAKKQIGDAIDSATQAKAESDLVEVPGWGKLKPAPMTGK
jgi:hypothetical protein